MAKSWRQTILESLQRRNREQVDSFRGVFDHYQHLFESMDSLRQNLNRSAATAPVMPFEGDSSAGAAAATAANERVQVLEQKLFRLQEELTDLHRRRGENAQMIVDLNAELAQKREQVAERDQLLAERLVECETLRHRISQYEQQNSELEATNQTLKDEYQALHLALVRTEKSLNETQYERDSLLARWMELKSRDADKMNAENDDFVQRRQQRMQRELEDATKDVVVLPPEAACAPVCISAPLPNKCVNSFEAHESEVNALCWSPSGRYLASGGGDRKVKLWTSVTCQQQCVGQYTGSNKAINSIAFDPDENFILAGGNDLASRVWGVSDFRLKYTLTGHSGQVMAARFLEGSCKAVTGSRDRTLKIWELARGGDCVLTLFASSICFDVVEYCGSHIVSGHFDSTLKVWDRRASFDPKHVINVEGHVTSLAVGSEYKVLCCTRDDVLKVIDMRTLSVCKRFQADGFHVGCDFSRASYSPDQSYVAAGTSSGEMFIWSSSSQKLERRMPSSAPAVASSSSSSSSAHQATSCVVATAWHPTGGCLVSSDRNRRIAVWSTI